MTIDGRSVYIEEKKAMGRGKPDCNVTFQSFFHGILELLPSIIGVYLFLYVVSQAQGVPSTTEAIGHSELTGTKAGEAEEPTVAEEATVGVAWAKTHGSVTAVAGAVEAAQHEEEATRTPMVLVHQPTVEVSAAPKAREHPDATQALLNLLAATVLLPKLQFEHRKDRSGGPMFFDSIMCKWNIGWLA